MDRALVVEKGAEIVKKEREVFDRVSARGKLPREAVSLTLGDRQSIRGANREDMALFRHVKHLIATGHRVA